MAAMQAPTRKFVVSLCGILLLSRGTDAFGWSAPSSSRCCPHRQPSIVRRINSQHESRRPADGPLLILSAGRKDASPHSTASDSSDQQQSSFHRQRQQQQQHHHDVEENSDVHNHSGNKNVTAVVEKKIRLAQAQAEIDRILEGPDAPVDLEREMKKVIHVSAPSGPASIVEQELDEKESGMEVELYEAVKQQEFAKAANLKRELNHMHMDDCGSVLQANSLFYRAFSDKNLQDMENLWCKDSTATCIHPSGKPMVGYKAVCDGWRRMFEATGSFQRAWMEPHNIHIAVKGASMAVISCDEHVYLRRFVRGQKRATELINKLTATNIFRKIDGRWYMFHHHASWHPDSEVAKLALRQRKVSPPSSSTSRPGASKGRLVASASSDSDLSIGMDGILGLSDHGPLLGTSAGKKKFGGQPGGKPIKRIVMGDINDILNGQLGDLFGGGESSGASAAGDDDDGDDATENGAILRFGRMSNDDEDDEDDDEDEDGAQIEIVNDDEEDDEDDDDDDDEEDEDEGRSSGPHSVSIIKDWARSSASKRNRNDSSKSSSSSKVNRVSGAPKDELRQNCIGALRRLCDAGSISPKQKRILLTDIITCSARGEFSMVEVAFELLCGEAGTGSDADVAEEEFADQCRVFASSLSDATSPFDSPSLQ